MGQMATVKSVSKGGQVVDAIAQMILTGDLEVGEKLPPEQILADQLGVSRTILRESMKTLAARGLIEIKQGSGTTVARPGDDVTVDIFSRGEKVVVTGTSKGKGFQGVMKRHNYRGGPGSHGSMFNRAPGSVGASASPSRVWKNTALPGHMGDDRVTVKNIEIFDIRKEQNLLLVKGAVPGANGGYLIIKSESPIPVKEN